jgi:peptidoglycan hydrolase-like protein with peptidoglycan-binding domain
MKAQPFLPFAGAELTSDSVHSAQSGAKVSKLRQSLVWKLMGAAIASSIYFTAGAALAQVYSLGSTGNAVSDIQQQLGVGVDGVYGPETETAVMNFQSRYGLQVDGQAGPATLQALGLPYLIDGNLSNVGGPTDSAYSPPSNLGERATVRTSSGIGVQIRDRPNGNSVGGLDDGATVYLSGQQETSGGYTWAELARPNRGWVATDYLVPYGVGGPVGGNPGGGLRRGPYVVAVPGNDYALFTQVRRAAPDAYRDTDSRGNFINAGSFNRRSEADTLNRRLRNQGFDARVIYD